MKATLALSHLEDNSIIRDLYDEKVDKLSKYTSRFKEELVHLHGALDKNPHKDEFYTSLTLYLPIGTLHCREKGEDYAASMTKAFLAMIRQLGKHTDKLTREKRRKVR